MPLYVLSIPQIAGIVLALAAIAYLILALRAVPRLRERTVAAPGFTPPVSILKPVCGTDEDLYACLKSFCEQDWPRYEVIFGAHTEGDAAIPVVKRLMAEFPNKDIRLVVDESLAGANRKAANLANIFKTARYDHIVLADADVVVDRDCIKGMISPLADPKVGAVASIYKGLPANNAPSRFGALYLNDWFVPSVCVDVDLRGIDFVFGALSAIRRDALQAIGGFERLAGCLAEDFSMGRFVDRAGWSVVLSPYACDTIVSFASFKGMLRHEARWQRCERACRPFDHFMSVVTWPLPLLLLLLVPQPSIIGLSLLGLEITLRIALHFQVRRFFRISGGYQPWLVPLRECVCFLTWAGGLFGNKVYWGNSSFSIADYRRLMNAEARNGAASAAKAAQ